MLISGDNVGIATYEYRGLYNVHWYFQSARGREAIELGTAMIDKLFTDHGAELLRGLIKTKLRASRWACRQLGFKSYGILRFADEDENELFCMTKEEFLRKEHSNGQYR